MSVGRIKHEVRRADGYYLEDDSGRSPIDRSKAVALAGDEGYPYNVERINNNKDICIVFAPETVAYTNS